MREAKKAGQEMREKKGQKRRMKKTAMKETKMKTEEGLVRHITLIQQFVEEYSIIKLIHTNYS